jgi:hypothetical protein
MQGNLHALTFWCWEILFQLTVTIEVKTDLQKRSIFYSRWSTVSLRIDIEFQNVTEKEEKNILFLQCLLTSGHTCDDGATSTVLTSRVHIYWSQLSCSLNLYKHLRDLEFELHSKS